MSKSFLKFSMVKYVGVLGIRINDLYRSEKLKIAAVGMSEELEIKC